MSRTETLDLVSVEGGIGAGKSSVMAALKAERPSLCYVEEPVETWEKCGLLQRMYDGSVRPATFQLAAMATRFAPLLKAVGDGERLIVSERCVFSDDAVFARTTLDDQVDLTAYKMAYDALLTALPPKVNLHIIYLKAGVDTLQNRMTTRDRPAERVDSPEAAAARRAYLEKLHARHDAFFCMTAEELGVASVTRHVIDAAASATEVAQKAKEVLAGVAVVKREPLECAKRARV